MRSVSYLLAGCLFIGCASVKNVATSTAARNPDGTVALIYDADGQPVDYAKDIKIVNKAGAQNGGEIGQFNTGTDVEAVLANGSAINFNSRSESDSLTTPDTGANFVAGLGGILQFFGVVMQSLEGNPELAAQIFGGGKANAAPPAPTVNIGANN